MENIQPVKTKATPKDVFLHLLMIGTLYASAVSLIALLFQYVNKFLPDALSYDSTYGLRDAIRWSLSALLVVFPVYVWVMRLLERDAKSNPEKRHMAIRKWLINLTLFISAITIIVDLGRLIYNYLGGDLTIRFLLKILVVLLVAVIIFAYYIWELRRESAEIPRKMRWLCRTIMALVAGVIVGGFLIVGSPQAERLRRFDERRVNDLSSLQYQLIDYWQRKGVLPASMDDLRNTISGYSPPQDPATGAPYTYHKKSDLVFELCAGFDLDSRETRSVYPKYIAPAIPGPRGEAFEQNWDHGKGEKCFERIIDPEMYKPYPKVP